MEANVDVRRITPQSGAGEQWVSYRLPAQYLRVAYTSRDLVIRQGNNATAPIIGTVQPGGATSIMLPTATTDLYLQWDSALLDNPHQLSDNPLSAHRFDLIELWASQTPMWTHEPAARREIQITAYDRETFAFRPIRHASSGSTGLDPTGSLQTANHNRLYNNNPGSLWDAERGNTFDNYNNPSPITRNVTFPLQIQLINGLGVWQHIIVTNNPGGAETLSLTLESAITPTNPGASDWITIADYGTLFTGANGDKWCIAYPGINPADYAANVIAKNIRPPRFLRWVITHSGAGNWTYRVNMGELR